MSTPQLTKVVRIRDGRVEERCTFPSGYHGEIEVWEPSQLRKDGQPNRTMAPLGRFVQPRDYFRTYDTLFAPFDAEREVHATDIRNTLHDLATLIQEKEKELITLYAGRTA